MTPERQRHLLILLLVVLAVVVGWRLLGSRVGGAGAAPVGSREATSGQESLVGDLEELRVADLDLEAAEFRVGRDLFRFVTARPQQPPKPAAVPAPKPQPHARPAASPPPQNAAAQPPPVDLVYLGRFGPTRRPVAVFSDGTELYNVLEGGVVKDHFLVDKIGYESADLKFVNFPDAPAKRLAIGG